MKNSTLSRKPGNDMKANASLVYPVRGVSQAGGTEADAFDGTMGDGVNRSSTTDRYSSNQHGGAAGGNYGMGPRVGNVGKTPPGVNGKIDGGATAKSPANPNKIYMGLGPRKGNG